MDSRHINPIRSIFLKKIFFFLLLIGTVLVRSGTRERQTKLPETVKEALLGHSPHPSSQSSACGGYCDVLSSPCFP